MAQIIQMCNSHHPTPTQATENIVFKTKANLFAFSLFAHPILMQTQNKECGLPTLNTIPETQMYIL